MFWLFSQVAKYAIGLFQSFNRADVVPEAGHLPRVKRHARVKPLDQAAGLIRIVAFLDVLVDQSQH